MKNNLNLKERLYSKAYAYSKKTLSFKYNSTSLLIKLILNSTFGILISLSIIFFEFHQDIILLSFSIEGAVIAGFLIDLTWESAEIKRLKREEKTYSKSFIKLLDDYKLAQKDIRARDEFLSIVSHELKTPLTVMLLKIHSELNNIRNAPLANFSVHQLVEVLKSSEQQIIRLKTIINDLVDVSLITTGRMNLALEDTDLVHITKQVNMSFSEVLKRKKYKIKINAQSPVVGKWDKVRIEQIITNLFSNAIKYGDGKPIDIHIIKSGEKAKFIIQDRGIGIGPTEQKVIFDLFKRVNEKEEYKKSSGVGLYISSQIVKMHGGKIKVSSFPSQGTTFTVELPL